MRPPVSRAAGVPRAFPVGVPAVPSAAAFERDERPPLSASCRAMSATPRVMELALVLEWVLMGSWIGSWSSALASCYLLLPRCEIRPGLPRRVSPIQTETTSQARVPRVLSHLPFTRRCTACLPCGRPCRCRRRRRRLRSMRGSPQRPPRRNRLHGDGIDALRIPWCR